MSDVLTVFTNEQFGRIRTTIINGEPWFVGKDIAEALGYSDTSKMLRRIDNEDKMKIAPPKTGDTNWLDVSSMIRQLSVLNESGLYNAIFGSQLESAKQFKHWITSEVLPQIRKTGGYIPITENDDEKTILAKALEIQKRTLEEKDIIINEKTKALAVAQPKADIYDKLICADGYMSFNVAAKELGMGRNRLMAMLRDKGVLFRDGLSNIAYQKYCERGYFVVKFSIGKNGFACGVTKVTPKGLTWLYKILNGVVSDLEVA